MTTLVELDNQRKEIVEISNVVKGMMNPEQLRIGAIAKVTHILLCDLFRKMDEHMADEHKDVLPSLLNHEDQAIKNAAWGLINNDKLVRPEFNKYAKRWLKDCEFQFTDAFLEDTNEILACIDQRMDIEYQNMYAKVVPTEVTLSH